MASDENLGFWEYNGRNGLQGAASSAVELPDGRIVIQKDPDNPAVLEDEFIAYCLRTSRRARIDFERLYPDLDSASQERLAALIAQNPRMTSLIEDPQDHFDKIQHKQVTEGVRTRVATRPRNQAVEDRVKP
jgi:hypothetical protein